jgi:hypothetical protein
MYIQSNMAARSCNHCYSGKTSCITHSEYVSVVLGIQLAQNTHRVILSSVVSQAVPYFSTLSQKRSDFRDKFFERKMCVLNFYTTFG